MVVLNFLKTSKHSILIGLSLFILLSCKEKPKIIAKTEAPPVSISVSIVEQDTANRFIECNGSILANDYVDIQPEISGRLTYLNVPEGRSISQGTLIARIYDQDLQAQLKKQEAQLALAKLNAERLQKLVQIEAATQNDYDIALTNIESINADISYTKALISKTFIVAPFDGIIGTKNISIGAYVTPQTIIANFQAKDGYKMDVDLPAKYLSEIKIGDTVNALLEGSNNAVNAIVKSIEPEINLANQNVKVRCRILGNARMGSFVKAKIEIAKNQPSIFIPSNIIIPDGSYKKVFIVKNGQPSLVNVETGYRTASLVEITKGLTVGDSLVTVGFLFLRPTSKIKITDVKPLLEFKANLLQ